MATMRVRWTDKTPEKFRANMRYRTRHLRAADSAEDQIDLGKSEAEALIKAGWATMAEAETLATRGPGRPKKTESQSQPVASKPKQEQQYLTRAQLLSVAEKRGVELPPGYVTRDELAALVGDVSSDEVAEAGG